jgi:hypothetical protein
MRAVGRDGLPFQGVDIDAFDSVQASVRVAESVAGPVHGQRVGEYNVLRVQKHAALRPVHVGPLDLGTRTVPIGPEDFAEKILACTTCTYGKPVANNIKVRNIIARETYIFRIEFSRVELSLSTGMRVR